ncbi:MAG: LysR family transcriptional regulator [Longicatena sp.]
MNIKMLQIFQKVCEEENITKAAAKLYMTQPAVSLAIKELEEELQVQLFDRFGKRIYLNAIGKAYLSKVQRVLHSYEDLIHISPSLEENCTIHLGSSITIANDHLPRVLQEFKKIYPNVKVVVCVESASKILQRLQQHTIDLALVEGVVVNEDWQQLRFSSYDLQILCHKEHPLAKKQTIEWNEVTKYQWLLREKGSAARDTFDSACRLHQMVIEPLWTSVNSQALLQAVRHNLGVSILPDSIIQTCPFRKELHTLTIRNEILCNENHIVYDKGLFLNEPLKTLLSTLQQ